MKHRSLLSLFHVKGRVAGGERVVSKLQTFNLKASSAEQTLQNKSLEILMTHWALLQLQLDSSLLKDLQQSLCQTSDRRGCRPHHRRGGGGGRRRWGDPGLSGDEGDGGQTDDRTSRWRGNTGLIWNRKEDPWTTSYMTSCVLLWCHWLGCVCDCGWSCYWLTQTAAEAAAELWSSLSYSFSAGHVQRSHGR